MKKITQEELNEIARLHGLWIRGEAMGVRAEIRDTDLSDLTFDNLTFDKSTFYNSTFDNSTFNNSTFYNSTFYNSRFYNSRFYNSRLLSPTGESVKIKSLIGWSRLYNYYVFVAITESGAFVRMGCYWRSLEDWEKDFWNNAKEFPNDNSPKSNMRLAAYNFAKEWIKNNS